MPSATKPSRPRQRDRRRAFTLAELTIGLIVCAIVSTALAAFTLAVANCWERSSSAQGATIQMNQLATRLTSKLQDAKAIGYWRGGDSTNPPAMIFWLGDANGDGLMQSSELAVIQFNPDAATLDFYSSAPATDVTWTVAEFLDAGSITRITSGVTPTPLLRNLGGAWLQVEQPAALSTVAPVVKWSVQLSQPTGGQTLDTAAVSLRAAKAPN